MAKTREGRSLSKPRNATSRRNSNSEESQASNNIENGLYVHSSPPKVVESGQGNSGSAHIREYLRGGNISGLEEVVLEGNGTKLLTQSSTDPKVRAFLKTLPAFMSKIDLVHDAAERGNLRDLKTLLDRRKIARSKDSQGMGLMHKAVLSGNTEMVEYLADNYPETAALTDAERTGQAGGGGGHNPLSLGEAAAAAVEYHDPTLEEDKYIDNYDDCAVEQENKNSNECEKMSGNLEVPTEHATDDNQYKPIAMQLKEFNELLKSELPAQSDSSSPVAYATTSDLWKGVVDWDADEQSYFLSELFDDSNIIEEENVEDLSDDDSEVKYCFDDTMSHKLQDLENADSMKDQRPEIASASWERADLSAPTMSFSKKVPLPPTASGNRKPISISDDEELFKSYLPRRKLSPVNNPRRASLNHTPYEIASPTAVKKLEPLDPKTLTTQNASTGAIRKKQIIKKTTKKKDVPQLVDVEKLPENIKGLTKPSPRHISNVSQPIVPNSANIRELAQRRNKIFLDLIRREARRTSLAEESETSDQQRPASETVKLPTIVSEEENAPEVVERPRTPTVMPRSARERISISKMRIGGHTRTVPEVKFKEGAFKSRLRHSNKLTGTMRSTRKPTNIAEKTARKITKEKKPAQLYNSLGNLVFDGKKKRYPKTENTTLGLKRRANSVEASINKNAADANPPSGPPERISFDDDVPQDVQNFCRRLLWSTTAAAQADLAQVFKRAIHNELATEETLQVVYEHDVNYWAKNISERALEGILGTTPVTPPQVKIRRMRKRSSLEDSGIQSGNPNASTQTSNSSSPKKALKDGNMAEIVAKLEELNVKLESGKPRYRDLVEQDLDNQSKLRAFQERWDRRKSVAQQK